jgi:hypothetical protein
VGPVGRALALSSLILASERFLERPGEIALAAATLLAVAAVAGSLPRLLRERERRAARARLTPSLLVLTLGAAITFAAYLSFALRCERSSCVRGAGGGLAGLDRWWRAHDSWQWGAQLLIASMALAVAALAFWLSARASRRARPPLWFARLLYAAWFAVVLVSPAVYALVT